MPENIRKIHDVNILFKLNNKSRDLAMISGEISSSHPECLKVVILKKFGNFPKNLKWQSSRSNVVVPQTAILIHKRPSTKVIPRMAIPQNIRGTFRTL